MSVLRRLYTSTPTQDQCFVCGVTGHRGTSFLGSAVHETCHEWFEADMRTRSAVVSAPFTRDQVRSLNAYQRSGPDELVTCPGANHHRRVQRLIARKSGWRCCRCGYRQSWAYQVAADWSWRS